MAALDGAVVSTFTTEETAPPGHGRLLSQGAEARVFELQMLGRPCVAKQRFRKRWARARERRARSLSPPARNPRHARYRLAELDERLTSQRTRRRRVNARRPVAASRLTIYLIDAAQVRARAHARAV